MNNLFSMKLHYTCFLIYVCSFLSLNYKCLVSFYMFFFSLYTIKRNLKKFTIVFFSFKFLNKLIIDCGCALYMFVCVRKNYFKKEFPNFFFIYFHIFYFFIFFKYFFPFSINIYTFCLNIIWLLFT
jgi:hypothetical protein